MMTKMVLVRKTVSKVFGDFVSKVVSDSVDVLKSAIKNADLERKSYNQNLQTRLYQLIVDALNRFTYNKYEKQDKLYDAAESIIKGYISTKDNTDAIKSGLKMLVSDVNNDTCQELLETLCGEICRDDNSDLYKEIDMFWKRRESVYIRGEFAKIDQNDKEMFEQLNDLKEVLDFIKRNMNRQEGDKLEHNGFPIVNRADEYAKRWNENVFLNNFNERDENAGVNIKLKDLYLEEHLPHYRWRKNRDNSYDLRNLLNEYIENNGEKKMLLILGQPGIGKSTLVTWMMANLVEKKDDILVYQFASDLDSVDWQSKNLLNDIFFVIGLEYNELENKTLILDGFDEIHIGNDRERILNKLNQELKGWCTLSSFSLIITCRENYIYDLQNIKCDYVTLQAWEETQIENFCRTYWKKSGNEISEDKIQKILENQEIFGIPLILYMILALDVDIEMGSSRMDIYDQVFSLKKGGIYDRWYDTEHRINSPDIKKHLHRISQRIAFWIFENNNYKAYISQEKFIEICENEMNESGNMGEEIQSDTLIGNFFKLKHCEGKGTDELQFIHRSIYEFFVAVYFYESIHELTSKEEVAGKLGELLKYGCLSEQMCEFIKCKFDCIKEYNLSIIARDVFNIMLRDGMTYHAKEDLFNNVIERERNIFSNMLTVVGLWNSFLGKLDKGIITYLQCNREDSLQLRGIQLGVKNDDIEKADLSGAFLNGANLWGAGLSNADLNRAFLVGAGLIEADLSEADLSNACLGVAFLNGADLNGADLSNAHLSEADLNGADLSNAYLRGANLSEADLSEADLSKADLREANLRGANLDETIFNEEQVNILYKKYDLSKSMVLLSEKNEIISYLKYCISKHKGRIKISKIFSSISFKRILSLFLLRG